jgi:AcrR family transcriptional regulator
MIPDQGVRLGAVERRKQLLGAARDTFGSNGFTATSMNDIAIAAGVTKPVLYQHFESKHQLFLEVLTDTAGQLVDAIAEAVGDATSGRAKLESGFSAYVRFFDETPSNFQVIYGEGVRSEPEFARQHRALLDSFTHFVAEHIDIETLDQGLRLLAATAVGGQLEAVVGQWLESGQPQPAEEVASLLSSLAWRGLRGTS